MKKQVRLLLLVAMIAVMLVMTAMFASAAEIVVGDGDGQYPTIEKAIEAASEGDTIKISKDVTLTANVTVSKTLTFDGTGTVTFDSYRFVVSGAKVLTINGGTYEGGTNDMMFQVSAGNSNGLVVNDGTFRFNSNDTSAANARGMIYLSDGTASVTIDGGEFFSDTAHPIVVKRNGMLTITDGEFTHSGSGDIIWNPAGYPNGKTTVTGGNFTHTGTGSAIEFDSASEVEISGTTINTKADAVVVNAAGTITTGSNTITASGDGSKPFSGPYYAEVFKVGETTYKWVDAWKEVTAGGTITVTGECAMPLTINKSVTLTGTGHLSKGLTVSAGDVVLAGNLQITDTIYADGGTLTMQDNVVLKGSVKISASTVTVKDNVSVSNASYTHTSNAAGLVLFICNSGSSKLYIYGGTFAMTGNKQVNSSNTSADAGSKGSAMFVTNDGGGAQVVIYDGTFTMSGQGDLLMKRGGYAEIHGGTFVHNGVGSVIQPMAKTKDNDIIIAGGTFKNASDNTEALIHLNQATSMLITGGTFANYNSNGVDNEYGLIRMNDGNAVLTIQGGDFISYSAAPIIWKRDGTLSIESKGGVEAPTFTQRASGHVLCLYGDTTGDTLSQTSISTGTFMSGAGYAVVYIGAATENATISVTGGEFHTYGTGKAFSINSDATITLNGTSIYSRSADAFNLTKATNLTVTNSTCTFYESMGTFIDGNTAQQVKLFSVGGTAYAEFADALEAAKNDGTITLLGDVHWPLVFDVADATVTLTGNKTVDACYALWTSSIQISAKTVLTLDNVTVKGGYRVIQVVTGGENSRVVINAGAEVSNTEFAIKKDLIVAAEGVTGTTVIVNGATLSATGSVFWCASGMTLEILDNSVITSTVDPAVNPNGTSVITIRNATITAPTTVIVRGAGTTLTATGSTFYPQGGRGVHIQAGAGAVTLTNVSILLQDGIACCYPVDMAGTADLTVTGGTFECGESYGSFVIAGASESINITGATLVGYRGLRIQAAATVTVEDSTWYRYHAQANGYAVVVEATNYTLNLNNFTVSDGTKSGGTNDKISGSWTLQFSEGGTVNITGGSYTVNSTTAMFYVSDGNVTVSIEGATITQKGSGCVIEKRNGTLNITDSALSNTGTGDVLLLCCNSTDATNLTTITGGTMIVTEGAAFKAGFMGDPAVGYKQSNVVITGTRVVAKADAQLVDFTDADENAGLTFVNAMLVNQNVTAESVVTGNMTLTDCIVLTLIENGQTMSIGGSVDAVLNTDAPQVKFGGVKHYAWMTQATEAKYYPTLDAGASVRVTANNEGIRFTATVSADANNTLRANNGDQEVTYGMLIAPIDYVLAAGAFTHEALAEYADAGSKDHDTIYKSVIADVSRSETLDGVSYAVALINIRQDNEARGFAAIAFAYVNGEYFYSEFSTTDNVRNMRAIAEAEIAVAFSDTESDVFKYNYEDKWWKYDEAQLAALRAYLA